jgi:S-adenosylmethionine/arginine decarboxylase-like enzyme
MVIGQHLVLDLFNVKEKSLNKLNKNNYDKFIKPSLLEILKINNLQLVSENVHFSESNLSLSVSFILCDAFIHLNVWPTRAFIGIDVFTSGKDQDTKKICHEIKQLFDYEKEKIMYLKRGIR